MYGIVGVSIQSSMYFDSPKMGGQKTIKSYPSNCDLLLVEVKHHLHKSKCIGCTATNHV